MPEAGQTGVTSVIWFWMPSNTAMMVGRIRIASGIPSISGFSSGRRSISRTMS